jgi:ribosomal protein S18 acetylase RimI-like enzyme
LVSAAYLWLDTEKRVGSYSAAGHPPLLHWREGTLERIESNGVLFGVLPEPDYPVCAVDIKPGDRFLLYTDGVTEPENTRGDPFGDTQLEQVIRVNHSRPASELLQQVLSEIRQWQPTTVNQKDDITLIVVDVVSWFFRPGHAPAEGRTFVQGNLMKRATLADVDLVRNILLATFKNDPHLQFLLEESKNERKLNILIDYVVDQTFRQGEIYLSDDNNGIALWDSERNEKMSLHYIWRNLAFLVRIGIKPVVRIVKSEAHIHNNFRKYSRFCHLYMIGVLPEAQGKGLASTLMNPMLQSMKEKSIPVFLETANLRNVGIYKKKGFKIFETLTIRDHNVFLMSIES